MLVRISCPFCLGLSFHNPMESMTHWPVLETFKSGSQPVLYPSQGQASPARSLQYNPGTRLNIASVPLEPAWCNKFSPWEYVRAIQALRSPSLQALLLESSRRPGGAHAPLQYCIHAAADVGQQCRADSAQEDSSCESSTSFAVPTYGKAPGHGPGDRSGSSSSVCTMLNTRKPRAW